MPMVTEREFREKRKQSVVRKLVVALLSLLGNVFSFVVTLKCAIYLVNRYSLYTVMGHI